MNDKDKLTRIETDVSGFEADMTVLKADLAAIRTDVTTIKADVAEMKTDMKEVRSSLFSNSAFQPRSSVGATGRSPLRLPQKDIAI